MFVLCVNYNNLSDTFYSVLICISIFEVIGFTLSVSICAPYFGDPVPDGGVPGRPFYRLWDFEVVEVFLLGEGEKYLELEFG